MAERGKIMDFITVDGHTTSEEIIKKSRFIANTYHVETEEEVNEILKEINKLHYKATHNCYAYVLGEKQQIQKFNDDGEPAGTAGKPILEVILNHELTNTLVVVTRYFGGIKLGAGGLIRAYSGTANLGINESTKVKMQNSALMSIKCDYGLYGIVNAFLEDNNFKIEDTVYTDSVEMNLYIPVGEEEKLKSDLVELTNDQVKVECLKREFIKIYL